MCTVVPFLILEQTPRRAILEELEPTVRMPPKKKFDVKKEIRKLARERVGQVPSSKPIEPKTARKKPKYKKPLTEEESG